MRRQILGLGCLIAGLLCATDASARPASQPLFPPVQFEQLGLQEGVPQIHVTSIAQDSRGFLWVGTQAGGLARYDGDRFVHYPTTAEASSLSSQFVTALAADPNGLLWIGTGDGGLNAYDPTTDKFIRYRHEEGKAATLGSDAVTALAIEKDGTLWVGLGTGGVDRFDPKTKAFARVVKPEFSGGEISAIQSDGNDQLFIASNGGGVMAVATASTAPTPAWLPVNDTISRNVTAIRIDSKGTLWIGTDDAGLYELPKGEAEPKSWLPREGDRESLSNDKITHLFEDRDHGLWVSTQFGLNYLDPTRAKVTRYAPDPQYPMRTATYLQFGTTAFQDRSGILWFGSLDFGLYKLDPMRRSLQNYAWTPEFGMPSVFCEAKDGTIWAGTYSSGLYAYDFKKNTYIAYASLGTEGGANYISLTQWLSSIHCAQDGTIWLGGSGLGLIEFNPTTEQHVQYAVDPEGVTGPTADRIEQILEGPDGKFWLATWGGGLNRFDPKTKKFELVSDQTLLPSPLLHRIQFDVKDPRILWVGAANGGLTRFDTASRTSTTFRGAGARDVGNGKLVLSKDTVQWIYQQPDGVLWLGTNGGGLDRFEPASAKVTNFSQRTGLPSDVIYGILRDDADHLWLTTTKGLVRFDLGTNAFVTFTSADGLGSSEFTMGGVFKTSAGEFFVCTVLGFNRFFPNAIKPDAFVPPVVITKFRLFDTEPALPRPIWETPRVELSYRDSVVSFNVAALAYAAPDQVRFQYMLEGFQSRWLAVDKGEFSFTNLDPGNYTLKVKAANRHGVWNETPTEIRIYVEPPIWRTKAAFGLYLALTIGAVLLIIRYQRERLRRVEREGRLALVEQELQLTGAVQTGFLPDTNEITSKNVRIVGFYKPADSCGGDWWWHAQLSPTRHLILVGDVTGHGAGSAMVTAAVATAFNVYHALHGTIVDVNEMLTLLNQEVLRVSKGKYQMALAALDFDEADGSWTCHGAGAPPMLTLDGKGKHRVRFCPGTLLGSETVEFGVLKGQLSPGERILLYTDGIPEIALPDGNIVGLRRFAQLYEQTRQSSPSEAAATLVHHAEQLRAGRLQQDDWTFALLEWTGAS
jgi:ligand-binding sensor domain-containing protein/serine phosphatase RsbU (regulator of sigma subunit)